MKPMKSFGSTTAGVAARSRRLLASAALVPVLLIAGCGSGGSTAESSAGTTPASTTPASTTSAGSTDASSPSAPPASGGSSNGSAAPGGEPTCQAAKVGPVTRCENFYTDYWPKINAELDKLYAEAKATDGGRLVVWDWYELSPEVIAQFNKRFPDIKIETRGLTYNLSSAIVTAKTTGERNSDIVSGSITSMTDMYDQGFWEKVDWTQYGVPKEFLTIGAPELMPDSVNGSLIQYNTAKVQSVPTSLDGLTDPQYKGKIIIANYQAGVFSGYGKRFGEQKMVDLINSLKSSGNMTIADDTGTPLSSGDKPIALNQTLFNPNPQLKVAPFDATNVYLQFSGVNSDAKNKAAAKLWVLWNAFDPQWLHERMTNPDFATSQVPFPGLPESVFAEATGLAKTNADGLLPALADGRAETETQATRDDWNKLIDAADKALNG